MTIASQISRLQNDKECMRQAIIDKGVDVAASVSFDDYAACISCITSGPKTGYVDVLVVGGGGGGFGGGGGGGFCNCMGGNGGDGLVIICYKTDGSYGINCATGGTKTTSGDYTIHTFTSSGTFTIVS